jgi:37-kD nucleoid-associated bacterial protein
VNIHEFSIETAVVHDVPRGNDDESAMTLTDAPIELDAQLRGYFERKVRKSLGTHGVEVTADPEGAPCVRDAVSKILADATAIVEASREVALHLHSVQTGRNPPGLLVLTAGTTGLDRCIGILKLEREEGVRFQIREHQGRRVVDLAFLRDLTLTDKTKIFKTAILTMGTADQPMTMHGRASDDQRGMHEAAGVAQFFLGTFLGCSLTRNPEKTTYDFVQAAQRSFDQLTNPEKQGRYQVALLATMQDNALDVSPRRFADQNLDAADRPPFLAQLREAGLDPNVPFEKDTTLVRVKNGFHMTFNSGMVLVGRREDLESRIDIRPPGQRPGVDINDAIKRLRGR